MLMIVQGGFELSGDHSACNAEHDSRRRVERDLGDRGSVS